MYLFSNEFAIVIPGNKIDLDSMSGVSKILSIYKGRDREGSSKVIGMIVLLPARAF